MSLGAQSGCNLMEILGNHLHFALVSLFFGGSSATGNRFGFINNSTLVPVSFLRLIVTLFLRHISHDLWFTSCLWIVALDATQAQNILPTKHGFCGHRLLIWASFADTKTCVMDLFFWHLFCVCVLWLLGKAGVFLVYADNSHSSVLLTQDTIEIRWTSTSFTMRACPMTRSWCTASIKGPRGRSLMKTSFFI